MQCWIFLFIFCEHSRIEKNDTFSIWKHFYWDGSSTNAGWVNLIVERLLRIGYSKNSFFTNSVFNVVEVFHAPLSIWREHHLSKTQKNVLKPLANSLWMYCRNLNFLGCALHLSCFQGYSEFLGVGFYWQLVGFLCRKQCVQGLGFWSKRVWFCLGRLSVLMVSNIWKMSLHFSIISPWFLLEGITSSKNKIACFLAVISAKWIVMIRLQKIGRQHRP